MKYAKQLFLVGLFLALSATLAAGGIHTHLPRGVNAAHDTVEVDAGDQFIAANVDADTVDVTGDVTAGFFYGDGSNLTGVGLSASSAVTLSAKAGENIDAGEAVYISGATGQVPQVSLADNTDQSKSQVIGVAAETKTTGQTILIRVKGLVTGLDTSTPGWSDGEQLYLSAAGALVNSRPTSGEVWTVAYVAYSNVSTGKLLVAIGTEPHYLAAASGEDVEIRLGDSGGVTSLEIEDYGDNVVAKINSDGGFLATDYVLDGTTLTATFSEANSALDGIGVTVTAANLTELTDASETTLHSHAGGGGALDDSVTTDSMLINDELTTGGFLRRRERAAFKLQDIRDGADNGYSIQDIIQYKDEYFASMDLGAGGYGILFHMNPDTSSYGLFTEEDNPGSGRAPWCFAIYKGDLYVGYGQDANDGDIAVWNEALGDWTVVYDGSYDTVYDLQVYGDSLYAGMGDASGEGDILSTGDGSSWVVTHNTIDYTAKALEVWNGKLYAATSTAAAGGYGYLWEYDGDTWTVIGNPNTTHDIICLKGFGKYLFMGMGDSSNEGDLYTWDGDAFNTFSLDTSYDRIDALEVYNGRLIIGYYDGSDGGDVVALNGEDGTTTILNLSGTTDATAALYADRDGTLWIGSGFGNDQAAIYKYSSGGNQYQGEQDPLLYDRHFRKKVTFKDSIQTSGAFYSTNNILLGTENSHGGDLSIVISTGTSPTETVTGAAALFVEDIAGSAEMRVRDEADNVTTISANVGGYPASLAVDALHPYAAMFENSRVGLRTYMATRRAYKLLQQMAHAGGFLSADSTIIAEVDISVRDWDADQEQLRIKHQLLRDAWFLERNRLIALSDSILANWEEPAEAPILRALGHTIEPPLPKIPDLKDAPPLYEKKPRPAWITESLRRQGKE